jgi:uncharacterized protein YhhL (DUF1145 family)
MNKYNIYLTVIILVKVTFLILAGAHVYLTVKGEAKSETDKKIEYWKERLEFVFVILMAILFIYLFNPYTGSSILITSETKTLLYLFGIFLLITANWEDFFKESKMFKRVQAIVGKP